MSVKKMSIFLRTSRLFHSHRGRVHNIYLSNCEHVTMFEILES